MAARKTKTAIELTPKDNLPAPPDLTAPEHQKETITYYRTDDAEGVLFYQKDDQWFRFSAYIMDGSARPERCDPEEENLHLEPVKDNEEVARIYAPVRRSVIDAFHEAIETLPIQEMEALIPLLLVRRNLDTYQRQSVAASLDLNKKAIGRYYTERWYYQHPDGSPLQDEEKEKVALERGAARENPNRGRDLRAREADKDGEIVCPVSADGFFYDAPFWEAHRRGRNWASRIKSGDRSFLKAIDTTAATGPQYAVKCNDRSKSYTLEAGDLLELAADYYSEVGEKVPTRQYFVIKAITEHAVVFLPLPNVTSLTEAEKAAKELATK